MNNGLQFFQGKGLETVVERCRSLVPFAKVGVIIDEKWFTSSGKNFLGLLKSKGLKPITIIASQTTFKEISELFYLPEDIRLIICQSNLCVLGEYFATVKNIPCVIINSPKMKKFLSDTLRIVVDGKPTLFKVTAERHVWLNEDLKPDDIVIKTEKLFPLKIEEENIINDLERIKLYAKSKGESYLELLKIFLKRYI